MSNFIRHGLGERVQISVIRAQELAFELRTRSTTLRDSGKVTHTASVLQVYYVVLTIVNFI